MTMPPFLYVHAGTPGLLDRIRYKLKECWLLVLVLIPLALRGRGTTVVHNSVRTNTRFTDDFIARRAEALDLTPDFRIDAFQGGILRHGLGAMLAAMLALVPRPMLLRLVRWVLRRRAGDLKTVVLFFDAHLSGFLLALSLRDLGVRVLTLQHGLYLRDDRGSMMGIRNFVSDGVLLWNEVSAEEYRRAEHADERLILSGQYGFSHLGGTEALPPSDRVALCPPYSPKDVPLFQTIAGHLPPRVSAVFSLHPLLRSAFAALDPQPISEMAPPPRAAICGDSGAIMDCLARRIPVVTVAERTLASAHLTPHEAQSASPDDWQRLIETARSNLEADRVAFGFDPDRSHA